MKQRLLEFLESKGFDTECCSIELWPLHLCIDHKNWNLILTHSDITTFRKWWAWFFFVDFEEPDFFNGALLGFEVSFHNRTYKH